MEDGAGDRPFFFMSDISLDKVENVRRFILAILAAAVHDHNRNVPMYDNCNEGTALPVRLDLDKFRSEPRVGDKRYARSLYTAARWLLSTE